MATAVEDFKARALVAYFEEPEHGVPDGCTGWYHSYGRFALDHPARVFDCRSAEALSPVRQDVAGPFASHAEAVDDLERWLSE